MFLYIYGAYDVPLSTSAVHLTLCCEVTQSFAIDLLPSQSTIQNKEEENQIFIWWSKLHIYLIAWFITHLLWWACEKWGDEIKKRKRWVCEFKEQFFSWKPNPLLFPLINSRSPGKKMAILCWLLCAYCKTAPATHSPCLGNRRKLRKEVQGLDDLP